MALALQQIPGTYYMRSFEVGGGGGVSTLAQSLTAVSGGATFTKSGTYTGVSSVVAYDADGTTISVYNGVIGLSVSSASGGNTTFAVVLADGSDPFTGVLKFTPF